MSRNKIIEYGGIEMLGAVHQPESAYDAIEAKRARNRKILSRLAWFSAFGLVIGGGVGVTTAGFEKGYAHAFTPQVHANGSIQAGGTGSITKINVDIQPITIMETQTHVTGMEGSVKMEISVPVAENIKLPAGKNVAEADVYVNEEYMLDPKNVVIEYDPAKKQLTYDFTDSVIETKLSFPVSVENPKATDTNKEPKTIDGVTITPVKASFSSIPRMFFTNMSELVANGNENWKSSDINVLGGVASSDYSAKQTLSQLLKLNALVETGNQCTSKAMEAEGAQQALEENVKKVMGNALHDPEVRAKNPDLKKLPDSLKELDKLTQNAEVKTAEGLTAKPNEDNADQLKAFMKDRFYENNLNGAPKLKCGVAAGVHATRTEDGGGLSE